MNEDELRKSLLEEIIPEDERKRCALHEEAQQVWIRFLHCQDAEERRQLKARYYAIDRELDAYPDDEYLRGGKREKTKAEIEQEAHLESIEKGRKRLVESQKAGVREAAHARIRGELEYLLRNYTPANDNKIDTLIDKWRRSGDPAYDPSIRVRFREVRKKKNQSDYAR